MPSIICSTTRGSSFAHGEVIEEKKRLGALREDVVDAMIEDVGADGGMDARGEGDFQFGADAIGAGDQNGSRQRLGSR